MLDPHRVIASTACGTSEQATTNIAGLTVRQLYFFLSSLYRLTLCRPSVSPECIPLRVRRRIDLYPILGRTTDDPLSVSVVPPSGHPAPSAADPLGRTSTATLRDLKVHPPPSPGHDWIEIPAHRAARFLRKRTGLILVGANRVSKSFSARARRSSDRIMPIVPEQALSLDNSTSGTATNV